VSHVTMACSCASMVLHDVLPPMVRIHNPRAGAQCYGAPAGQRLGGAMPQGGCIHLFAAGAGAALNASAAPPSQSLSPPCKQHAVQTGFACQLHRNQRQLVGTQVLARLLPRDALCVQGSSSVASQSRSPRQCRGSGEESRLPFLVIFSTYYCWDDMRWSRLGRRHCM
jgi:hypothetical protein